jgi:hypothetical protein
MLAELAPPEWRPVMRLVAFEIADRSPDPAQLEDGDQMPDGSIRSRVWLEGHEGASGKYIKGLTDYLGMPKRQICDALKALSDARCEMRIQLTDDDGKPVFDKNGLPIFARIGHVMRFRIPPLGIAVPVDNPDPEVGQVGTQKGTHLAERSPFWVPTSPERAPKKVPVFPTEPLSLSANPFPASVASAVNGSVEERGPGPQASKGDDSEPQTVITEPVTRDRCEYEECPAPQNSVPRGSRYHTGCELLMRRAAGVSRGGEAA